MINSTERSDILVFNCYLCHVRFLLTYYVCSTKIGEISDISKCFENFVSQTLGVLTRIYAAELRNYMKRYNYHIKMDFENKETKKIEKGVQEVKSNENEQIYIILSFPYTFTFLSRSE